MEAIQSAGSTKAKGKKSTIIHRQTFQNSNNIVELTVKTIPKKMIEVSKYSNTQSTFVRDCELKKTFNKVEMEKNNNGRVEKTLVKNPPASKKEIHPAGGGRVTVEVSQKKSRNRHKFIPKGETWRDVLQNYSTIESDDENIDIKPPSAKPKESQAEKKRSHSVNNAWPQIRPSRVSDSDQSSTFSDIIVNRQIPSGEQSFQEGRGHGFSANLRENKHQERNATGSNSRQRLRMQPVDHNAGTSVQGNFAISSQGHHVDFAKQGTEPNRLLSDDVNASPFGESALELLNQLRERLKARGDCEGIDILGAVEKYFAGQGSTGVGVSNVPQSASTASPVYREVFPTPSNGNQNLYSQIKQWKEKQAKPCNVGIPEALPDENSAVPNGLLSNSNQQNIQFAPIEENLEHCRKVAHEEELKREIIRQQKIIADKERDLLELRTLSTHLIAQREQLAYQSEENASKKEYISGNKKQDKREVAETRGEQQPVEFIADEPVQDNDSDASGYHSIKDKRDYMSTLLQLRTENDILRDEIRSHRDLILNLESELAKAYLELQSERHSRIGLSSSRLSGSAPNLDLVGHHLAKVVEEKKPAPSKPFSRNVESEVDSAYEEKTSSRLTSKFGSPQIENLERQNGCRLSEASVNVLSKDTDFATSAQKLNVANTQKSAMRVSPNMPVSSKGSFMPSIPRSTTHQSNLVPEIPLSFHSLYSNTRNASHSRDRGSQGLIFQTDNSKVEEAQTQCFAMGNVKINSLCNESEPARDQDSALFPSFTTFGEEYLQVRVSQDDSSLNLSLPSCGSQSKNPTKNYQVDTSCPSNISKPTMESTRIRELTTSVAENTESNSQHFVVLKASYSSKTLSAEEYI
ncbi:hypothetical protein SK128_011886 [Halocaridina rubra]|uniref:Uncharacterized protein n=1 Tax=Halocaridina rubra TaxID=373956 RepID=A0AAN8WC25_HALRR